MQLCCKVESLATRTSLASVGILRFRVEEGNHSELDGSERITLSTRLNDDPRHRLLVREYKENFQEEV